MEELAIYARRKKKEGEFSRKKHSHRIGTSQLRIVIKKKRNRQPTASRGQVVPTVKKKKERGGAFWGEEGSF